MPALQSFKKNQTSEFFDYEIRNNPVTSYKNKKRGRPGKNAEKIAVTKDRFDVSLNFNEKAFDEEFVQNCRLFLDSIAGFRSCVLRLDAWTH